MENKWSHLAKFHVPIIPNSVKPKNLAIQSQETLQTIKVTFSLCRSVWWLTGFSVWIDGQLFLGFKFDSLWGKESGCILITAGNVIDTTVDKHINTTVQISPVVTVAEIILGEALTLQQFALRRTRVFNNRLDEWDWIVLKEFKPWAGEMFSLPRDNRRSRQIDSDSLDNSPQYRLVVSLESNR